LISSPSLADKVVLLNGQNHEGEIVKETLDGRDSPDEPEDEASVSDAVAKGKAAAEADFGGVDGLKWFGTGCILNLIGVGLAWAIVCEPPQSHLIGKSPEYVAAFSKAYSDRGGSLQFKYAALGCMTTTVGLAASLGCFLATFDMPDPFNP
jgi:hypothetical protein